MNKKEFSGKEVTIMTCSNCNTKCKHCYISYDGNFLSSKLQELCDILLNRYRVLLNGTEILLHPEYFNCLKTVKQNFLLTNGLELQRNPSIIKEIAKIGIKFVGTSYHFGIHNSISQVQEATIMENIKKLQEYGVKTDLRVTINSQNYHLIRQMCDKAISLNASGIKFTNYMNMGLAVNLQKENILSYEQVQEFFNLLEDVRKVYSKDKLLIRRCGSFGKDHNNPNCKFVCVAAKDSVVITPNLNVYPCFFLAKEGMEIGKVENGKIMIYNEIYHDGTKCLACEVNNNGYELL